MKEGGDIIDVYYYQEILDTGRILYKGGIGNYIRHSTKLEDLGEDIGMDISFFRLIYEGRIDLSYINGDCPVGAGLRGGLILPLDNEEEAELRLSLEKILEYIENGQ